MTAAVHSEDSADPTRALPWALVLLTLLYGLSSLGHFSHNAEFICEYPNLPASFTRLRIYLVWGAITAVGLLGVGLLVRRAGRPTAGLLVIGLYTAMGFDGLGHYVYAPMELHSAMANATILGEVAAAALLLAAVLHRLARPLRAGHHIAGPA